MNCSFIKLDEAHYYLKITNLFEENELRELWKEIDFLLDPIKLSSDTSTARDSHNNLKSQKNGVFIDSIYTDRKYSNIFKYYKKHLNDKLYEITRANSYYWSVLPTTGSDCTLLNYYQDGDHYREHEDSALFSQVIFLNKEPKKFTGGNLVFTEFNECITPENNSLVMFPSFYTHKVETTFLTEDQQTKNNYSGEGRVSIITFYNYEG